MNNQLITVPNWTYWQDPYAGMPAQSKILSMGRGASGGLGADILNRAGNAKPLLGNWFASHFGQGKSLLGNKMDLSFLKGLGSNFRATQLYEGGPTLGKLGTYGMGAYQGIKAIKGLTDNVQSQTDYDNLVSDVKGSAYANPMASQYLSADQNRLLRQARTGSLDAGNWGGAMQGAAQGIPQALLSALIGGVAGGAPGAIVGGVGSLLNSGIQGYGNRTREQADKLNGLYSALQNAEMSYRDEANSRLRNRHFNYMY